jgi:hypothetical protein
MSLDERQLLNARIGELLHWALVSIRNFTYAPLPDELDRREEINALADLLHNLPRYMVGHDEHAIDSPAQLRDAVVAHVRRFYPEIDPELHRCVELLDMDEEQFLQHHRDHQLGKLEFLLNAQSGGSQFKH